ncbi:hypothetical protein [Vreelandella jeotgali]|uniref:hypothetical protein n=1 Tax=Vreelandella jeotgali TaxID=553386 RepID=UPI0003470007|nr:hypothetical protein [Halomonas jeotgali]
MVQPVEQIVRQLENNPDFYRSIANTLDQAATQYPNPDDRLRIVAIMLFAAVDMDSSTMTEQAMKAIPDAITAVAKHLMEEGTAPSSTVH